MQCPKQLAVYDGHVYLVPRHFACFGGVPEDSRVFLRIRGSGLFCVLSYCLWRAGRRIAYQPIYPMALVYVALENRERTFLNSDPRIVLLPEMENLVISLQSGQTCGAIVVVVDAFHRSGSVVELLELLCQRTNH